MNKLYHYLKSNLFLTALLLSQIIMSSFSDPAGTKGSDTKAGSVFTDTIITVINSFSPTSANTGDMVRIYGKNFVGITAVSFGGTPASYFGHVSDSEIVAFVGTGSSGNVSVTTTYGTATKPGFVYTADTFPPVISSFTPASGKMGTYVTIYGTHFTKTTKVAFGGTDAISFTVLNDSSITAQIGTGKSGDVSVTTSFGTGTKSGFDFIPSDTVLTVINSFSPTSANTGDMVRIYGKYFIGVTAISFGGTPATYVGHVSDSEMVAIVGKGSSGDVSVTAAYGTATKPGFIYTADTFPPVISSFTPTSGKTTTPITIYGAHFTKTSKVGFGGIDALSFTVVNDSTITSQVATGKSGDVSVTTPFGTGTKAGFVFIPTDTALTVINSFSPTSAKAGDMVRIYGKYFTGVTAVSFGGTPASYFGHVSDSEIVTFVGAGSSGNVSVTAQYGTATKPGFTFISGSTVRIEAVNTNARTNQNRYRLSLILYPNPAKTYVIAVHPSSTYRAQLQVIDITGKLIKTINVGNNITQTKVPVTGLLTGIYKVVWSDGKNKTSQTLLVK